MGDSIRQIFRKLISCCIRNKSVTELWLLGIRRTEEGQLKICIGFLSNHESNVFIRQVLNLSRVHEIYLVDLNSLSQEDYITTIAGKKNIFFRHGFSSEGGGFELEINPENFFPSTSPINFWNVVNMGDKFPTVKDLFKSLNLFDDNSNKS